MPHTTLTATETSLNEYLANADQPVLLDLWAPWCAPCRALAPTLERLAEEAGELLTVLKIDVDEFPAVRERYGVRGIPTMILLKGETELARLSGSQPMSKLKQWLSENGASIESNTSLVGQTPMRWGAFYGDAQLRDFLVARMKQHADQGDICTSRAPVWIEGKGTFAATLVHSENLDVFERVTGLPANLAPALDFVGACGEEEVSTLLDNLRLNADVSQTAVHLLQHWLSDQAHPWTELLDEPELDELRLRWLALCARAANKQLASAADWDQLRAAATSLENPTQDPYRQLQGMLANLLAQASPLPESSDALAWNAIFQTASWCNVHLLMNALGWNKLERTTPGLRSKWFEAHERELGGFSKDQLQAYREQWNAENADFLLKEQAFHSLYPENAKALNRRHTAVLTRLLFKAPLYLPA